MIEPKYYTKSFTNTSFDSLKRLTYTRIIKGVSDKEVESKEEKVINKHELETSEDPTEPVSSVACGGCGAKLHCQNKDTEGFIPASEFKEATKKDLVYKLCLRCYFLKTNKKIYQLESSFDHDKFIAENLCAKDHPKRVHVVLLVDLLDIPNSIYSGWSKLIGSKHVDIVIVGNKLDLLPDTGPGFYPHVMRCLVENFAKKNILGELYRSIKSHGCLRFIRFNSNRPMAYTAGSYGALSNWI